MENSDPSNPSLNQGPQSEQERGQSWTQLTAKYLHQLPQQLDGIKAVLEIKDYSAIKKQAHRIKGTSGTYRLDTISKSAAQLERLAEGRNPNAIVTAINKVKQMVELETSRLNSQVSSTADSSERASNG